MSARFEVTANLNVRSGPTTDSEVYETLVAGRIVDEAEIPVEWCPIEMEDNTIGWISRKYLREAGPDVPEPAEKPGAAITGKKVVSKAMTQNKDPYIFGYEVDLDDPNPDAFDCSELVQWDCHQLEISPEMPDGAANQYEHCKKYNTIIPIDEAVRTPGALLFRITPDGNHVVISRGDGSTIEAKGKYYGVGVFSTAGRDWTAGALIPGVSYN